MGEIVNLRMARKRKSRDAREQRAEENRVRFGRTKSQRDAEASQQQHQDSTLDAHKRKGLPPDEDK